MSQRLRPFLFHMVLALFLIIVAGCGARSSAPSDAPAVPADSAAPSEESSAETADSEGDVSPAAPSTYREAPMLAELVASGQLPPVDERLPENPLVVEPVEEIGVYGGTWLLLADLASEIQRMAGFPGVGLLMWNREQTAPAPSLVESWDIEADGKEFVLHLRRGLKWSDGEPFTADDILFWYEDIVLNDELMPVKPAFLRTASGSLGTIEKVDDVTVRYVFEEPHGLFIILLTKELWTYAPKHYLSQFHINYVEEAELAEMLAAEGMNTWVDLFWYKAAFGPNGTLGMGNPELPTMFPWLATVEPPSDRFIFTRNPYFWAVDTAGNQLPYIDQVDMRIVDAEVMNLQITAGEPNFQASRIQSFQDIPLYMQYAEENEYRVIQWGDLQVSEAAIWINQNTPDPVDREIYQDVRFRHALSLAINRDRINETLYLGLSRPTQATIGVAKYMKDEYLNAYIEYDPERANALLDEMGLTERDSEGYRLKPDGARLAPVIEVPSSRLGMIDNLTMITEDYAKIGVELIVRPIDQTLWTTRMESGQMQFAGWPMAKPETETDLVPINTNTDWAPLWGLWYATNGAQGEEPPQHIKELQAIWTELLLTTDEVQQEQLIHQILQAQAENLWAIGVVGPVPKPIIAKTWFRNVNENCIWSFHHGHFLGCTAPYQFFIEADHQ
jgi:peptide/nickel transport system substrate-binding protein